MAINPSGEGRKRAATVDSAQPPSKQKYGPINDFWNPHAYEGQPLTPVMDAQRKTAEVYERTKSEERK